MTAPARRSVFVTGTDTGVGKTVIATTLVRGLAARGINVGVMKPAETGVGPDGPLDAQALRAAAGETDPLEEICPFQFALPAAPNVAAAAEGGRVDMAAIEAGFATLAARHDLLVVEGAGGILVPMTDELDMADVARQLELPVLVVARAALGTINHTLLTLRELQRRGLELAGVVVSHSGGRLSDADTANLGELRRHLGDALVGEIPPLVGDTAPSPEAYLDLDRIDAVLTHP